MRRSSVRLVAATFNGDVEAKIAREALASINGVTDLRVHARQRASGGGPAYAVVSARIAPSGRAAFRDTVARLGGHVVIDLDEAPGSGSRPGTPPAGA